jgi:hypothetical protein
MKVQSTSMWISPFWKDLLDKGYDDIIHKVLRIETALRSHEIGNVKSVGCPYYREHELFCSDVLPHSLAYLHGCSSMSRTDAIQG